MISIWLKALWGRVWLYIAAVGAAFGAMLAIRQSGKRAGRQEAEAQQLKQTLQGVEDARKARSEIDALSDGAVRDRAKRRMRRKQGSK